MQKVSVFSAALLAAGLAPLLQAAPRPQLLADPGVINPERIEYWLKKHGEIDDSLTRQQIDAKVTQFTARALSAPPRAKGMALAPIRPPQAQHGTLPQRVQAVSLSQSSSTITKSVKVLGVLVDFPDLPHDSNRLQPADTEMYYPDYTAAHYDRLLFSADGFPGPSGQTLQSARQYFTEESGGSFDFAGQVFDWVRADHNAAYYGAPDGSDNDSDVGQLVFEAVSKLVASGQVDLSEFDQEDQYDHDGDGNVNEPDGIIDHVMVFHSSIGEEAGGGYLRQDAIWSHRFVVVDDNDRPKAIPGTDMHVYGYTIQPIDAAAGVCTHEFGHDLGLPDEYDTDYAKHGSPVGLWSLMSGGSWLGAPQGSAPSSMSAWARDYLQRRYGGNWIRNRDLSLDQLDNYELASAVNHEAVNQLTLPLPPALTQFFAPYGGKLQYYSGTGHQLRSGASASLTLPSGSPRLTMMAHWQIEQEYDYLQVKVNGEAIAGSHSSTSNSKHGNLGPHYTGNSSEISGAEGDAGWVKLAFDLSRYAGQAVTLSFEYVTDEAQGGYGFVMDDLAISNGGEPVWHSGAEANANLLTLDGFKRITHQRTMADHGYFLQLRQFAGNDAGLADTAYNHGVLMWYYNRNYYDNNVGTHPGFGLTGVVDADQQLIPNLGSTEQIKDAAFSLYPQKRAYNDPSLTAVSRFDDALDYSAPEQPQSGLVLPKLGLTMAVSNQAPDSATATVDLNYQPLPQFSLTQLTVTTDGLSLTARADLANAEGDIGYIWETGDGRVFSGAELRHSYGASGSYTLHLTAIDADGRMVEASRQLTLSDDAIAELSGSVSATVNGASVSFGADISGGRAPYRYQWNFGDGDSSTLAAPSHSYSTSGSHQVTLTVTDEDNRTLTLTKTVSVTVASDGTTGGTSGGSTSGGGGGGGSLGWFTLLLLPLLGRRARR